MGRYRESERERCERREYEGYSSSRGRPGRAADQRSRCIIKGALLRRGEGRSGRRNGPRCVSLGRTPVRALAQMVDATQSKIDLQHEERAAVCAQMARDTGAAQPKAAGSGGEQQRASVGKDVSHGRVRSSDTARKVKGDDGGSE